MTEFNLSDWIIIYPQQDWIHKDKVKEFIRLLKANIQSHYGTYKSTKVTLGEIDKLAGEKLI